MIVLVILFFYAVTLLGLYNLETNEIRNLVSNNRISLKSFMEFMDTQSMYIQEIHGEFEYYMKQERAASSTQHWVSSLVLIGIVQFILITATLRAYQELIPFLIGLIGIVLSAYSIYRSIRFILHARRMLV